MAECDGNCSETDFQRCFDFHDLDLSQASKGHVNESEFIGRSSLTRMLKESWNVSSHP